MWRLRSGQPAISGVGSQYTSDSSAEGRTDSAKCRCRRPPPGAGVAQQADDLARLDAIAAAERARDRREMEILREHHAAEVRQPDVDAAALLVPLAVHAIDDAVLHGVDVFAPQLAAEVDAARAWLAARQPGGGAARARTRAHRLLGIRWTGPGSGYTQLARVNVYIQSSSVGGHAGPKKISLAALHWLGDHGVPGHACEIDCGCGAWKRSQAPPPPPTTSTINDVLSSSVRRARARATCCRRRLRRRQAAEQCSSRTPPRTRTKRSPASSSRPVSQTEQASAMRDLVLAPGHRVIGRRGAAAVGSSSAGLAASAGDLLDERPGFCAASFLPRPRISGIEPITTPGRASVVTRPDSPPSTGTRSGHSAMSGSGSMYFS